MTFDWCAALYAIGHANGRRYELQSAARILLPRKVSAPFDVTHATNQLAALSRMVLRDLAARPIDMRCPIERARVAAGYAILTGMRVNKARRLVDRMAT